MHALVPWRPVCPGALCLEFARRRGTAGAALGALSGSDVSPGVVWCSLGLGGSVCGIRVTDSLPHTVTY